MAVYLTGSLAGGVEVEVVTTILSLTFESLPASIDSQSSSAGVTLADRIYLFVFSCVAVIYSWCLGYSGYVYPLTECRWRCNKDAVIVRRRAVAIKMALFAASSHL
jgi:hypothetical protein